MKQVNLMNEKMMTGKKKVKKRWLFQIEEKMNEAQLSADLLLLIVVRTEISTMDNGRDSQWCLSGAKRAV